MERNELEPTEKDRSHENNISHEIIKIFENGFTDDRKFISSNDQLRTLRIDARQETHLSRIISGIISLNDFQIGLYEGGEVIIIKNNGTSFFHRETIPEKRNFRIKTIEEKMLIARNKLLIPILKDIETLIKGDIENRYNVSFSYFKKLLSSNIRNQLGNLIAIKKAFKKLETKEKAISYMSNKEIEPDDVTIYLNGSRPQEDEINYILSVF